jgi:hypothetical protein
LKGREITRIRINTQLNGEPAEIIMDLKRRGLVTSYRDAVIQGLLALHEKVLRRDLMRTNLAKESAE